MSEKQVVPIRIAILTVSDSRTEADDTSGDALVERLTHAGHTLVEKLILPDDKYIIRAAVSGWIADREVDVVISTGGTGLTGRDITPEAVQPLFDKEIEGVGELFRWVSYQEIGTSTIASRCIGGLANGTFIFCLPGSTGACRTGWDKVIAPQLDCNTTPCNIVALMPRLLEK
ncbi:MAG: molybdenum cofactor biosynthesis protein B [Gammaproteobacteria bacterium]|nr:molybdenum cofactor biosynthesis protein B [Gammaproteobacteria bacterium]MBT8134312.1 molybdenum cofactor biosynthesis protein B [Gammaproteobacteria bacterium]NNJ50336.1 molybdenum cofactor biosynthesis protein B [Gammaproteobacteria bacterium]